MGDDGKKDKGWDYLTSDDVSKTLDSDDGSWGYQNEDGSGSYFGADGSWGYKNSDGSGSYFGADGSWGYKNSDGSGSYYGGDNERANYDSDESDEESEEYSSSSSSEDLFVGLADVMFGLGATAYSKHKQKEIEENRKEEERRREQERIRQIKKEKRKKESKIRNKRIKALLFNKKKILIGASTTDFVGNNVDYVVSWLKETGFNNIKTIPVKDLYVDSSKAIKEVEQVIIDRQSWFEENEMVSYDAEIIITYHMKREIVMQQSSKSLCKGNYNTVVQQLFQLGYTEIYTKEIDDLVTGWIKKDGSIEKIVINGQEGFKKGSVFEYDAEIVISYHSFSKKKRK